ncbi:hypothetical protein O3G_MSEX000181 [Manduca sexta]|nr:hypothetical protein O3G_MSEX000181 [Manduca sexta]
MRERLSEKEKEYNLLKAQKDKIHEINNAVTLDIIRREQLLQEIVNTYYKRLLEFSIVKQGEIDLSQPLNVNLDILFGCLINQYKSQVSNEEIVKDKKRLEEVNEHLVLDIKNAKTVIETKDTQLTELKSLHNKLQELTKNTNLDLNEKNKQLEELRTIYEDLCSVYNKKVEENNTNLALAEKLAEEVRILKETVAQKEANILSLSKQDGKLKEYIENIKDLQNENTNLKYVSEMITKEKETYASELKKSGETIKQNNNELDKMTSEILILRETVKESSLAIDTLKNEAKSLLKQNSELKQQIDQKCRDCSRLETNMKTHEKTAEIQSRMIIRLQKQKEDDDKAINEKNKQLEEMTVKYAALQKEYDSIQNQAQAAKREIEELKHTKESLEARISELLTEVEAGHKPRRSLESRRRRQSLHDSKRLFSEDKHEFDDGKTVETMFESRHRPDDLFMDPEEDNSNRSTPNRQSRGEDKHEFDDGKTVETMFESRHRPDDLFMDPEEDNSNRSTPNRQSRGRDSLISRTDQSEKDEEHSSRPSSVLETRKRRQSSHDLHRSVTRYSPSPHDHSRIDDALKQFDSGDSEVVQLRQQLSVCQQELEELRERYKDLDEECETCAEYLRERDDQCARLKREKLALEKQVNELKKLTISAQRNENTPSSLVEVGVNTDEDWTKLHSLVVDRMSYDAEVEKNKKLSKTIEELRYKNQDLKMTLAKMQKALEKHSGKDNRELEAMKEELKDLKDELAELRQRNKELDEECETCAEYLRERDEQNRRLKEAKAALEVYRHYYDHRIWVLCNLL